MNGSSRTKFNYYCNNFSSVGKSRHRRIKKQHRYEPGVMDHSDYHHHNLHAAATAAKKKHPHAKQHHDHKKAPRVVPWWKVTGTQLVADVT
ncbi:hypothetical protein F5H01DRAFT_369599 [Linnemannia elongata]|nr:hypothetical protein F5H01DRAFT_369599 [Linnemannia elongata]